METEHTAAPNITTRTTPPLLTEKPQPTTSHAVPPGMAQAAPQTLAQAMAHQEAANLMKPKPKSAEMPMLPYKDAGLDHHNVPSGSIKHATSHHSSMNAIEPFKRRLERGDHQLFSTSEEALHVRQIQSFHRPEGYEVEYDSKYVLNIIEEIILRVSTIIPGIEQRPGVHERLVELEREAIGSGFTEVHDELVFPINKISTELICKCHLGDGKKITEEIFHALANFSWEAKVVIAFAAFAMQYGEFWLVAQLYRSNPLARSVGLLMEVSEIMGSSEAFRAKFKAITDLINAMLDVAKSIFEFNEMLHKHPIPHDAEQKITADAHLPVAAYWTIRSIVACTSLLLNLMSMGHEYLSTAMENWELSSLAYKLAGIKDYLQEQKRKYRGILELKRQNEAFLALKRLFEVPHLDNMKILRALIYARDDQPPLYDGTLKTKVNLEVLRRKNVVLLVSGLDIPLQEFDILLQLYSESRDPSISHDNRFEMVWLPVVDRSIPLTDEITQRYNEVQVQMPWYSVAHPALIEPAVVRFIREEWRFEHKPMLVVLDPVGRITNQNAINMYWIWGPLAFPFTETREEALWREASWNMELLLDSFDQATVTWLQTDRFICVFGGDDIEWIRKFTTVTKSVARQLDIPLELLYVGKSTSKERIRRNNEIIKRDNLSSVLPDYLMWFFWARLNCMWNSREKHGMSPELDDKRKHILEILTFDSSETQWAVFGKARGETATKRGDVMLTLFEEFKSWSHLVSDTRIFINVIKELLQDRHPEFHCNRFFYPGTAGRAPHTVSCPECSKPMSQYLMYRCCND